MAGTGTFGGDVVGGNAQVLYKSGPGRLMFNGAGSFASTLRIQQGSAGLGAGSTFSTSVLLDSNVSFDVSAAGNPWNSGATTLSNFLGSN